MTVLPMSDAHKDHQKIFRYLGIGPNYLGYVYLTAALDLISSDLTYLQAVTTRLYPAIGRLYAVTPYAVERDIRTIIDICWREGGRDRVSAVAGRPLKYKPSNGQFLAILAAMMV